MLLDEIFQDPETLIDNVVVPVGFEDVKNFRQFTLVIDDQDELVLSNEQIEVAKVDAVHFAF